MLVKFWNHHFRITPQFLAVLVILSVSEGHPCAEEIYEKGGVEFPTASLVTVCKATAPLKEADEVLEQGLPDAGPRYVGIKTSVHPHMICIAWRRIMDPEQRSMDDLLHQMTQ